MIDIRIFEHDGTELWTRELVQMAPTTLFVFCDNGDRTSGTNLIDSSSWYAQQYGQGRQLCYPFVTTACLRGLSNAYPLTTQRYYKKMRPRTECRWTDDNVGEFGGVIAKDLADIKAALRSGQYECVIFPYGFGFDSKISQITKLRTPGLYQMLNQLLLLFFQEFHHSPFSTAISHDFS